MYSVPKENRFAGNARALEKVFCKFWKINTKQSSNKSTNQEVVMEILQMKLHHLICYDKPIISGKEA